jgi:hypothetical protein
LQSPLKTAEVLIITLAYNVENEVLETMSELKKVMEGVAKRWMKEHCFLSKVWRGA